MQLQLAKAIHELAVAQKKSEAAEKRISHVDGQFSQALQKFATSENQHLAALHELGLERVSKEAAETKLCDSEIDYMLLAMVLAGNMR